MTEVDSRKVESSPLNKPFVKSVMKWMTRANIAVYRATGGTIGRKWRVGSAFPRGVPICLVTTTGRKSGQPRTAAMLYITEGDSIVLVASQGGSPKHPLWFLNIQKDPEITVQIKRSVHRMRARIASGEERDRLWPRFADHYSDINDYQASTNREIPLVICTPI